MNKKSKPRANKKLAFWYVSNCKAFSLREEYVKELQKFIDIDIYGSCYHGSKLKDSQPDPCKSAFHKTQCLRKLFNSYKFYLSFENSKCNYYISEKYFKFYNIKYIFFVDLIPIVRGAKLEHYLKRAPSNYSFIYADDFPTPQSLANYLVYLDLNQTAYEEYFAWKHMLIRKLEHQKLTQNVLNPIEDHPFCEMCKQLHNETYLNNKNNPILKISEYYNPAKDCTRDKENQNVKKLMERMKNDNCFWPTFHHYN